MYFISLFTRMFAITIVKPKCNKKMDLPKTQLNQLRNNLLEGQQTEIAKECSVTSQHVCMQLNGSRTLREDIYLATIKKIKKNKAKIKKVSKEIAKVIA